MARIKEEKREIGSNRIFPLSWSGLSQEQAESWYIKAKEKAEAEGLDSDVLCEQYGVGIIK